MWLYLLNPVNNLQATTLAESSSNSQQSIVSYSINTGNWNCLLLFAFHNALLFNDNALLFNGCQRNKKNLTTHMPAAKFELCGF